MIRTFEDIVNGQPLDGELGALLAEIQAPTNFFKRAIYDDAMTRADNTGVSLVKRVNMLGANKREVGVNGKTSNAKKDKYAIIADSYNAGYGADIATLRKASLGGDTTDLDIDEESALLSVLLCTINGLMHSARKENSGSDGYDGFITLAKANKCEFAKAENEPIVLSDPADLELFLGFLDSATSRIKQYSTAPAISSHYSIIEYFTSMARKYPNLNIGSVNDFGSQVTAYNGVPLDNLGAWFTLNGDGQTIDSAEIIPIREDGTTDVVIYGFGSRCAKIDYEYEDFVLHESPSIVTGNEVKRGFFEFRGCLNPKIDTCCYVIKNVRILPVVGA